jgi:hypothetical protein
VKTTLINFVRAFLLIVVVFFSVQYGQVELYNFPTPAPFAGDHFYNPYQRIAVGSDTLGRWYKGNFHTHARAWWGITNGKQTGDEVLRAYQALGYDLPCISDYFSINGYQKRQSDHFVPVYEHGANAHKSHRLAIGSEQVDYYDITLWQNQSMRQYLINRLKQRSPVVGIAHPSMMNGHPPEMLRYLTGYDCLEVLNGGRIETPSWDAALTSGKAVWLLANDDCHNVHGGKLGSSWTMVHAAGLHRDSVLRAMRRGSTYGVHRRAARSPAELARSLWRKKTRNVLTSLRMQGDTLVVRLRQTADEVRFVGANGVVKKVVRHTDQAEYVLTDNDPYVRVEADCPELAYYFNPVIRTTGPAVPENTRQATLRIGTTVLLRCAVIALSALIVLLLYPELRQLVQRRRRQEPVWVGLEKGAKA